MVRTKHFRALTVLAAMMVLMLSAGPAQAAEKLDQQNTAASIGSASASWNCHAKQTFTAGMTGTLNRVSLYLGQGQAFDGASAFVHIHEADDPSSYIGYGWTPQETITSSGGWVDIDLIQGAQVTAGERYAIVTGSDSENFWYVWHLSGDAYTGGNAWFSSNCGFGWSWTPSDFDFLFKTYVSDSTAPTVTSVQMTPGQTGEVARSTNISATFSERMNPATITISTFRLYQWNQKKRRWVLVTNTAVNCSDSTCQEATLDPYPSDSSKLLAANKRYKAVITAGVKDLGDNFLDQNPSASGNQRVFWTFTTGSI